MSRLRGFGENIVPFYLNYESQNSSTEHKFISDEIPSDSYEHYSSESNQAVHLPLARDKQAMREHGLLREEDSILKFQRPVDKTRVT